MASPKRSAQPRNVLIIAKLAIVSSLLACAAATLTAQTNEWTWMGGSQSSWTAGVYGTLGTPAPGNVPSSLTYTASCTDPSGNFWLFGGFDEGQLSSGPAGVLNVLWKYTPSTGEWTWMSGSSTYNQPGVYGTAGVPASGNVPGARLNAAIWSDASGNIWLFGGQGYDSTGSNSALNDLWEFSPSTREWAWMGGSDIVGQPGIYGTLGTPAALNIPGSRVGAAFWKDGNGNFWLFGGYSGYGNGGYLNDLWEYSPSTKEWAWMSGSSSVNSLTPGPPARYYAAFSTDPSGNFWLYGGWGVGSSPVGNTPQAYGSDLWEYTPSTGVWTSLGGVWSTALPDESGNFGVAAPGNSPGALLAAFAWSDSNGDFWISSGQVDGGADTEAMWRYTPSDGMWVWMNGNGLSNAFGVYGMLGVPAAANTPGARSNGANWTDSDGNLWLFAGTTVNYNADNESEYLWNDLWKYTPSFEPNAAVATLSPPAGTYNSPQNVQISTTMPNATIYYTTNGSTPKTSSTVYSAAIPVTATTTINALTVASGYLPSDATAAYNLVVATPTFTPAAGTYTSGQNVQIATTTPGATIYYTTDGSMPTKSSTVYSGSVPISTTTTIQAIAVAGGYTNSAVASALYTMSGSIAATPNFSPAPGTYDTAQSVAISDSTSGATIYYTTNGTTPTTSSTVYAGPIKVPSTETIQAIAAGGGYNSSAVASALYTIAAAVPTFSPGGGNYTTAQTVAISDSTAGATIYYTTNGTTPTTASTVYSGPITVSTSETISAIAVAAGLSDSPVTVATYAINIVATPTFSPAAGTYVGTQTVTISDATAGASIYYAIGGSTPSVGSTAYTRPITVSSSETIQAIGIASNYGNSAIASATYTISIPSNPAPVLSSLAPAFASSGGSAFTLTVYGSGFLSTSTVNWSNTALATTYVSSTRLTAQVPAGDIASAGSSAITVHTPSPGGGASNTMEFESDSGSSADGPTITTAKATVTPGSAATYPVTLPSSASNVSLTCLNLPKGASCSYSANSSEVTIATSSSTPAGTYQITLVFTETLPGTATGLIVLPFLLLPLAFVRRRWIRQNVWLTICFSLVILAGAAAIGCGGGGSNSSGGGGGGGGQSQTVTTSGVVTLVVQ